MLPTEPAPPRVKQVARKSCYGKKPRFCLNPDVAAQLLADEQRDAREVRESIRKQEEQEKSNPKLHRFQVGGKGEASIRESWKFEREQCRVRHLPKFHCSGCDQVFTCKPHCGACVVLEVCEHMGWRHQGLTPTQIIQIQDHALGQTQSNPVTRGKLEELSQQTVIRIKPPEWSTPVHSGGPSGILQLGPCRKELQALDEDSQCLYGGSSRYVHMLKQRIIIAKHARAWVRTNAMNMLLQGLTLPNEHPTKHQLNDQQPWVQLKMLESAKWCDKPSEYLYSALYLFSNAHANELNDCLVACGLSMRELYNWRIK